MISEKNAIEVAEINWSAISFDGDGQQIYHFERDYLLRFAQGIEKAIDENRYESADDLDAEIHRLLEMKIDRFPQYAKSLLEGYATKVEVFDHMIKVAQAAGFESLTEAISVAKKARDAAPSDAPIDEQTLRARICRALGIKGNLSDDEIVTAAELHHYEFRRLFADHAAKPMTVKEISNELSRDDFTRAIAEDRIRNPAWFQCVEIGVRMAEKRAAIESQRSGDGS